MANTGNKNGPDARLQGCGKIFPAVISVPSSSGAMLYTAAPCVCVDGQTVYVHPLAIASLIGVTDYDFVYNVSEIMCKDIKNPPNPDAALQCLHCKKVYDDAMIDQNGELTLSLIQDTEPNLKK